MRRPRRCRRQPQGFVVVKQVLLLALVLGMLGAGAVGDTGRKDSGTPVRGWRAAAARDRRKTGRSTVHPDSLPMEHSLRREMRDAHDASGPSAQVWSASSLLRRRANVPIADFSSPEAADDKAWRCVMLDLHGKSGASLLQTGGVGVTGEDGSGAAGAQRVAIPLRLTPAQTSTLSLLTVAERLGGLARGESAHGTIYETIIHPAMNAFAYIAPRLIFMLAREILVILFQWILKWMVLDSILLPASAGLQPSSVTKTDGRAPWMDRAWASMNDLTQSGGAIQAQAEADNSMNDAASSRAGLNATRQGPSPTAEQGGGGAGGAGTDGDGSKEGGGSGVVTGGSAQGPLPLGVGPNGMIGVASEPVWPDPSVHWSKEPNTDGYVKPPRLHLGAGARGRRGAASLLQRGGAGGEAGGGAGNAEPAADEAAGGASLLQAKALPGRLIQSALSMTGLSGRVAAAATSATSATLIPRVREAFRRRLLPTITRTIARRVVETAVPRVTAKASILLVKEVTRLLLGDQRLRSKLVARLSARLLPRLSQGLTAAIAEATTHDPTVDHVCFLCQNKGLYCPQCRAGTEQSRLVAWRAAYYGRYYGAYHMGVWAKLVGW